jgi:hypothetical protein
MTQELLQVRLLEHIPTERPIKTFYKTADNLKRFQYQHQNWIQKHQTGIQPPAGILANFLIAFAAHKLTGLLGEECCHTFIDKFAASVTPGFVS